MPNSKNESISVGDRDNGAFTIAKLLQGTNPGSLDLDSLDDTYRSIALAMINAENAVEAFQVSIASLDGQGEKIILEVYAAAKKSFRLS